jgi:hypothetical protein
MSEKMELFEVVDNILQKKGLLTEEEIKANYNPFIINRAMANYQDLVFFAEKMNENWQLPPSQQYHFYYFMIDKRKRWAKWPKRDKSLDNKIALLKEYYGYSTLRARETIPIIDDLNLWDAIKEDLNKGGGGKSSVSKWKPTNEDVE